ncbi:T-cell antigen CD7, partial [Sciurus carolinensis]|nr:T-cell antigen CD7 [Sciurus carolinensis]
DNPCCTEGVVSVSRGRQAVMACNISNAFSHITVRLRTHGKDWTIFSEKAPGRFSRAGWQLQVQGGQAQLVIAAAQDAHAGLYLWRLQGLQRNYKVTSLNVSDAASQVLGSETLQTRSQATPQSLVGILVAVLLSILVVGTLGSYWHRRSEVCAACGDSSRPSTEVQQCPRYTALPEGASVNITCCTSGPLQGIYLRRSWPQTTNVIYYEDNETSTVDQQFQGRVHLSGTQDNLTITMHRLQRADSGTYTCEAVLDSHVLGPGTMLMVTEKPSQVVHRCQEPLPTSLALPIALAVGFFLMGLGLGVLCTLRRTQIKGMCTSRDKSSASVVYEDMSYSRCNTLSTPNQYQCARPHLDQTQGSGSNSTVHTAACQSRGRRTKPREGTESRETSSSSRDLDKRLQNRIL